MEQLIQSRDGEKFVREPLITQHLKKRWSPRSFISEPMNLKTLQQIFEAAATSMSSYNEQPWNIILTQKGNPLYEKLFNCLSEFNQEWVSTAPCLGAVVSKKYFTQSRKENRHRFYDSGAFMAYASLQACELGYQIHQMAGFSPGKLMMDLKIPHTYEAATMFVIGKPGSPDKLPVNLQKQEKQKSSRKALSSFIFSTSWGESYNFEED
ncbi:nitroreductase family protein [Mangrovibacterium lignilyticum]|uniref:nitroreductase family protein n=1 Tax=Mangrovibacterium lignilyticum TaxID=2668052 RepID=UPI0013D7ADB7|nr:nitroreductase family protein [Mangrovibacterium lignilyticum]